jgi:hypothetical protein
LTPQFKRRLVERGHDAGVDVVAFLEGAVEFELADHRAQRGLRQLRDRHDIVGRTVRGAHRIGHLEVQHAVDRELRVVLADADLAGHIQRDLLERMLVGDPVDEGDQEVQAGRQRTVVLADAARRSRRADEARCLTALKTNSAANTRKNIENIRLPTMVRIPCL